MKQSIGPSNDFSSIERDISVLPKNILKQSSLFTTINGAPTPNTIKTDSNLIGKKLAIYVLAEKLQGNKVVQNEKDRNSLLQFFRDSMEIKQITVSDYFRLGKDIFF